MIYYTLQTILILVVLLLLARQNNRFDLYLTLFATVWAIAVLAIRIIYGADQANFYSSDQGTQIGLLDQLTKQGFSFSLDRIIGGRYIVVAPVWLLQTFGLDALLAFKFLQAMCLILTYRLCSEFIRTHEIKVKLWHAILFSGPLFIFLSVLGLRDLEIVLSVSYFYLGRIPFLRFVALIIAALLRPHLAVALIFGWLMSQWLARHPIRRLPLAIIGITIGGFMLGGYGYAIGGLFKYAINYKSPIIFTQETWWRMFANLLGLQFLTFGNDIVRLSVQQLLLLRLFFIDTFLIPIIFIITLLNQNLRNSTLRLQVFISFVFFLGLASQTDFNSSRQNLPFLSIMGVLALTGILKTQDQCSSDKTLDTK